MDDEANRERLDQPGLEAGQGPVPSTGWACEEVPPRQRETSKGNSETSLAKVWLLWKRGRLKATERPTGVESLSQRRCGRLPNLHPLCRQRRREHGKGDLPATAARQPYQGSFAVLFQNGVPQGIS
jgi:hypothetical protein